MNTSEYLSLIDSIAKFEYPPLTDCGSFFQQVHSIYKEKKYQILDGKPRCGKLAMQSLEVLRSSMDMVISAKIQQAMEGSKPFEINTKYERKSKKSEPLLTNPLSDAIKWGFEKTADVLINHGADVQEINSKQTLFFKALKKNNLPIISLLLDAGVSLIDPITSEKDTPCHVIAVMTKCEEIFNLFDKKLNEYARNKESNLFVNFGSNESEFFLELKNAAGETPLITALKRGLEGNAIKLLEWSANPNVFDAYGNHLLHLAVEQEALKVINAVKNSVDLNIKNRAGQTPFYYALQMNRVKAAETLSNAGVDIESGLDNRGRTTLHLAGLCKSSILIQQILSKHPELIERPTPEYQRTPLQYTIRYADATNACLQSISTFLEAGSNSNCCESDGFTPLHHAVKGYQNDFFAIVQLLVKHGANVNAQTLNGEPPLYLAESSEICSFLKENGAVSGIFEEHVMAMAQIALNQKCEQKTEEEHRKQVDEETMLKIQRIAPRIHDWKTDTIALHQAAEWGLLQTAKLLIELGIPSQFYHAGKSPLYFAIKNDHEPIVEMLMNAGVDLSLPIDNERILGWQFKALKKGLSAWQFAAFNGSLKVLRFLEANKQKLSCHEWHSEAFQTALLNKKEEACIQLLEWGADPNRRVSGFSPISFALNLSFFDLAEKLLDHPQFNKENIEIIHRKRMPGIINLAITTYLKGNQKNRSFIIIQKLIQAGADLNLPNNLGETPLQIATREGDSELIALLVGHLPKILL